MSPSSPLRNAIQSLPQDLQDKVAVMTVDTKLPVYQLQAAARRSNALGKAAKALLESPAMQFRFKAEKETSVVQIAINIDGHVLVIDYLGGEDFLQNNIINAWRDGQEAVDEMQEWADKMRKSEKPYGTWTVHAPMLNGNLITATLAEDMGNDMYIYTKSEWEQTLNQSISDATWARMVLAAYNIIITSMSFPKQFARVSVGTSRNTNLHEFLYNIASKPKPKPKSASRNRG
jgi:hypothetical protein